MRLASNAGVLYNDKIYFCANNSNALFYYDLKSLKVFFVGLFEKESVKEILYEEAILVNNEIWFVPNQAENICCYNLILDDFLYIDLSDHLYNYDQIFNYATVYNDKIFFVPTGVSTEALVEINIKTKEKIVYPKVLERGIDNCIGGFLDNSVFYFIMSNGCIGYELELNTQNCIRSDTYIKDGYGYNNMTESLTDAWISPFQCSTLLKIDKKSGLVEQLELGEGGFFNITVENTKVFLLKGGSSGGVLTLDLSNNFKSFHKCSVFNTTNFYSLNEVFSEKGDLFFISSDGYIFKLDMEGDIIERYEIVIERDELDKLYVRYDNKMFNEININILKEGTPFGDLKWFVSKI